MKKLLVLFAALLVAAAAFAQSSPGLQYGAIPTAGQWNSYFAAKVDYNVNGIPIASGGTGAISATGALRNLLGTATSGYFVRGNGTTWASGAIQAGDVPTLNQNTTGYASGLAGGAIGSVPYQSAANTTLFLSGNTSTTPQFYTSTGTGSAAQAPTLTGSSGTGNVVLATNSTLTGTTITGGGSAAFTTLSASSTVSGTGFTAFQAAPNPIGSTTPNTGAFTTLSASSTVSGTGFSTYLASPPAIGGTVAAAGSFTTLSASSTVSGTGFSTYLASPPAIGGTAASTVKGTVVTATSSVNLANLLVSATAPTVSSCGTGASISAPNGTGAFRITVGTGAPASCVVSLPTAATGWNCFGTNTTTFANAWVIRMSATSTSSVTLANYNSTALTSWNNGDVIAVNCLAF